MKTLTTKIFAVLMLVTLMVMLTVNASAADGGSSYYGQNAYGAYFLDISGEGTWFVLNGETPAQGLVRIQQTTVSVNPVTGEVIRACVAVPLVFSLHRQFPSDPYVGQITMCGPQIKF